MLFFFSRPLELPGVFAFLYSIIGFVIVSLASELLRRIIYRSKNELEFESTVRSWLAGLAILGLAFLIGNLILAVPAIVILFFVQIAVIEPALDASDATFHRVDNILTVSVLLINFIAYLLAAKFYHRKIYRRFFAA